MLVEQKLRASEKTIFNAKKIEYATELGENIY